MDIVQILLANSQPRLAPMPPIEIREQGPSLFLAWCCVLWLPIAFAVYSFIRRKITFAQSARLIAAESIALGFLDWEMTYQW